MIEQSKRLTAGILAILAGPIMIGLGSLCAQESKNNALTVGELRYPDKVKFINLNSPYGYVVRWEDNRGTFYLYDQQKTNIVVTTDLDTFLQGLAMLPDGAEVARIDTCGAPLSFGMPTNQWAAIDALRKRKHFKMAWTNENNALHCVCETTGLVFYTEAPSAVFKVQGGK